MDVKLFFYNKDIFKNLNLNFLKIWDELIDVFKKLKENGYILISFGIKVIWIILYYIGMFN